MQYLMQLELMSHVHIFICTQIPLQFMVLCRVQHIQTLYMNLCLFFNKTTKNAHYHCHKSKFSLEITLTRKKVNMCCQHILQLC